MYFSQHLDTVGNGEGTIIAIGDYSGGGGTDFFIKPAANQIMHIYRLLVFFQDSAIVADGYGANGTDLTNGIDIMVKNDNEVLIDMTHTHVIKDSASWAHYCYDARQLAWGPGDEFLVARWTFTHAGSPVTIRGDDVNSVAPNGERFLLHLEDSFVHLVDQQFIVQGQVEIAA